MSESWGSTRCLNKTLIKICCLDLILKIKKKSRYFRNQQQLRNQSVSDSRSCQRRIKNLRTNIYSLNEEETYERDLETIAKKSRFISDWYKDFDKCFPNARFDYIVMEKTNDKLLDLMLLLKLLERLKDGGSLAIHTAEEMPLSDYEPRKVVGDWQILYKQSDE